jgi:hypothetical protein
MAESTEMDTDATTQQADASNRDSDLTTGLDLGNVYKQCSAARMAASNIIVTDIKDRVGTTFNQTPPQYWQP